MMNSTLSRVCRFAGPIGFLIALGAAAPDNMHVQIDDVGPLAQPEPAPSKPVTFQNAMYQAAPMPNPDVQAPAGSIQTEAQLSPKLLSPGTLFQGDGYSFGSSQQTSLDRRKAAAAGLGLTVPVDQ